MSWVCCVEFYQPKDRAGCVPRVCCWWEGCKQKKGHDLASRSWAKCPLSEREWFVRVGWGCQRASTRRGLRWGSAVRRAAWCSWEWTNSASVKASEKFCFQHSAEQKCVLKPWCCETELPSWGSLSPHCRTGSFHQQMNWQKLHFFNFWTELTWSECYWQKLN